MTDTPRFDRTLSAVMWTDAFLSAAVAVLAVVASPVVAVLGLPHDVRAAFGVAVIGCAALLAACGAVTAVLIGMRVQAGEYMLPAQLRLPLPAAMRPPLGPQAESGNDPSVPESCDPADSHLAAL